MYSTQQVNSVANPIPRSCLGPWSRKTPDRMGKEGEGEGGRRELNGRTETAAAMEGRREGCPLRKGKYWIGGAGRVVSRGYIQRGVFRDRESHFSLHFCKCVASDGTMLNQINDRLHSTPRF